MKNIKRLISKMPIIHSYLEKNEKIMNDLRLERDALLSERDNLLYMVGNMEAQRKENREPRQKSGKSKIPSGWIGSYNNKKEYDDDRLLKQIKQVYDYLDNELTSTERFEIKAYCVSCGSVRSMEVETKMHMDNAKPHISWRDTVVQILPAK